MLVKILVWAGEGELAGGFVFWVRGVGTMWHRGPLGDAYDEAVAWYKRTRAAARAEREAE